MRKHTSLFEATYEKGPILGRGASGVAFVVRQKGPPSTPSEAKEDLVAKEICIGRFDEKRRKDAFDESKMLQTLSHDNVVKCINIFLEEEMSVLYIVMEYADGGDLGRRIQAQRKEDTLFLEDTVMRVFVQIAAALFHIHSRRILHRDLKPANVFLVGVADLSMCTVKLGDFGIAKMLEGTACQAHSTVGTPSYLSPEICKNNPYGTKSDIWSLGVVLYELACLKVPFQAGNLPAMALMICTNDPKPLPDSFTKQLADLTKQLLIKEPVNRPAVDKVLQDAYVNQFVSESLRRAICNDTAAKEKSRQNAQNATSRGSSMPSRKGTADSNPSRLPSCGPSMRPMRPEKYLFEEDAKKWCWRRSGSWEANLTNTSGTLQNGTTPRVGPQAGRRGAFGERSRKEGGEKNDRKDSGEKNDRLTQPDSVEKNEKNDMGTEKSERDRGQKADKAERAFRADRIERGTGYDDSARRVDRVDRGDRGDRADRLDRLDRVNRTDRGDRADRAERAERGNRERIRSERTEQGTSGNRTDQASRGSHCGSCESCERDEHCFVRERAGSGSRVTTPEDGLTYPTASTIQPALAQFLQPTIDGNMTVESMNALDHSGFVDTTDEEINGNLGLETNPEVMPPAELQEPAPPGVGPHPGTALFVASSDSQPRMRKDKLRRGRPPLQIGQKEIDNGDIRSPTRTGKRTGYKEDSPDKRPSLSSTAPVPSSASTSGPPAPLPLARSVSPARSLGDLTLPLAARDPTLRPSGSTPALPPLPPLLAPTRGPVRSRSSVGLHEARGEPFQPLHRSDRGATQMFRTAPLAVSSDRDRDREREGNTSMSMGQGPPPPTLAPPPQRPAAPQNMVPPPPQRQAARDDQGGVVRLAPKLPSGQQDSRHWREPPSGVVRGLEAASTVPEGWCDVDARLSSARLQSVV